MSRVEKSRCNNCSNEAGDYDKEVGWIKIDDDGFHVSGGRQKDGPANTVRYITHITTSVSEDLDFCCVECLLHYLFFSDNHSNSTSVKTYNDFIKKLKLNNVSIPGKLYESITAMFEHIKSMIT